MIVGALQPVTADAVVAAAALSVRSPDAQPAAIAVERVMVASTPDPRATRHGRSMVVMDAFRMHAAARSVGAALARSELRQTCAAAGARGDRRSRDGPRARQDRHNTSARIAGTTQQDSRHLNSLRLRAPTIRASAVSRS